MPRGRPRKQPKPEAPETPAFTDAERVYVEKYPGTTFKPGSLSQPGEQTVFGKKRVITLICSCGTERVIATSDAFHVSTCRDCKKQSKKAKKKPADSE